jgi:hypothetical protein
MGTAGKLVAIAGLAPVVKAGEAKESVQDKPALFNRKKPRWATQYMLEPSGGEHNLDSLKFIEPDPTSRFGRPITVDVEEFRNMLMEVPRRIGKTRSVLDHAEGVDRLCKDRGIRSIARGKAKP